MSQKLKLLFDECVGRPVLHAMVNLLATSAEKPELAHVLDYQSQGIADDVWLPQVAAEEWIVLTADRGKRCGGANLPLVCRDLSITHVLLSGKVHQRKSFDKVRLILEVWPGIAALVTEPRGSGFSLRLTQSGRAKLVKLY